MTQKKGIVNKFPEDVRETEMFVALEKVHGSNFSFYCDGKELHCARRNAMLSPQETFYGWQVARDKYKDGIFEIFKATKEINPDIERQGMGKCTKE